MKIAQSAKNRVKKISHSQKVKITSDACYLADLKVSSKREFRNLTYGRTIFFVPLTVMQTQNSKWRQILGDRYQKSAHGKVLTSRPLQTDQVSWRYGKRCRSTPEIVTRCWKRCVPQCKYYAAAYIIDTVSSEKLRGGVVGRTPATLWS